MITWVVKIFFLYSSSVYSCNLFLIDFPGGSDGKASAYNAGNPDSIPGSGRSAGEENRNSLQCSCPPPPKKGLKEKLFSQPNIYNIHKMMFIIHTLTCLYKKCITIKEYTRPKMKQTLLNKLWPCSKPYY